MWEEPLRGHGHVRVVVGDFVEELGRRLLGAKKHVTDSTCDYCPDMSVLRRGVQWYIESKAVGLTRSMFMYKGRLEKDADFSWQHKLMYVVWHHRVNTLMCSTVEELQAQLLLKMQGCYLIPYDEIRHITEKRPIVKLNSHYGHCRDGAGKRFYGEGVRVPLSLVEREAAYQYIPWEIG